MPTMPHAPDRYRLLLDNAATSKARPMRAAMIIGGRISGARYSTFLTVTWPNHTAKNVAQAAVKPIQFNIIWFSAVSNIREPIQQPLSHFRPGFRARCHVQD